MRIALLIVVTMATMVAVIADTRATVSPMAATKAIYATVPYSRYLARCTAWPSVATDGIDVELIYSRLGGKIKVWQLRKGDRVGQIKCYKLGQFPAESGWKVFACHGPTIMRDLLHADPACSHAVAWPEVTTANFGGAGVAWVQARSTCCGDSDHGDQWKCSDPSVVVNSLDGLGPGVVAGTNSCEEYETP